MVVSYPQSDQKDGKWPWYGYSILAFDVAAVCISFSVGNWINNMGFWPEWTHLLAILSMASGTMSFVIGKNGKGKHDTTFKKVVIFLLGIFVALPVGILALLEIHGEYSVLKFSVAIWAGLYVVMMGVLFVQQRLGNSKLDNRFGKRSFHERVAIVLAVVIIVGVILELRSNSDSTDPLLDWMIQVSVSSVIVLIFTVFIKFILEELYHIAGKSTDEPPTNAELSRAVRELTDDVKAMKCEREDVVHKHPCQWLSTIP